MTTNDNGVLTSFVELGRAVSDKAEALEAVAFQSGYGLGFLAALKHALAHPAWKLDVEMADERAIERDVRARAAAAWKDFHAESRR